MLILSLGVIAVSPAIALVVLLHFHGGDL